MKKGLLAMLSLCAGVLVMDLSNALTELRVRPMEKTLLQGLYGYNVVIRDAVTGKNKDNLFSLFHGKSGLEITYLGDKANKRYDVFFGSRKVAELRVEQQAFNENVRFVKNDDGTTKIYTIPDNDLSRKVNQHSLVKKLNISCR